MDGVEHIACRLVRIEEPPPPGPNGADRVSKIFVSNLAAGTTKQGLLDVFVGYGNVVDIRIRPSKDAACAFVSFAGTDKAHANRVAADAAGGKRRGPFT